MTLEKLLSVLEKITDIYNKLYGDDENITPFEAYVRFFSDGSGRVMLDCHDPEIRKRSKLKFFEDECMLFRFSDLNDFLIQLLEWCISLAVDMKAF